jgi:hypothetical protein
MKRHGMLFAIVAVGLVMGGVGLAGAQDVAAPPKQGAELKTAPDAKQAAEARPGAAAKQAGPSLNDLPKALKASPGCLGVQAVTGENGQMAIFSWFENKEAVLKWYYSDVHQDLIHRFFPNAPSIEPLKDIPDNSGPIMVIASVTPNDPKSPDAAKRPFKQIAIELYQPLPGGLALGGRFAPDTVKVPGMHEKK